MQTFGKLITGMLFTNSFFSFILISTVYFQILNSNYLFYVFEKHQVYEKIPSLLTESLPNDPNLSTQEKLGYSQLAQNIPPSIVENIIRKNLLQILSYIHGRSEDIIISFPTKSLGLAPTDTAWSLTKNAPVELSTQLHQIHGLGEKLRMAWIVSIILLVTMFLTYGKVTKSKWLISGKILISSGSVLLILSLILKFFLIQLSVNLANAPEPSQKILGLFAESLFSEIVFGWMIIGSIVAIVGSVIFVVNKKLLSN